MPRFYVVSLAALALAAGGSAALAQSGLGQSLPAVMQGPVEQSREAIDECRDRRLNKELSSYKESAQCSDPKIFAAWRDAHYPHMDLITEWLNAREAASAQVDQHQLTPQQFEQEMDQLTLRLTAEEQRRRAGLLATPDGQLQLQLPPGTQVIGVVTPPGQDKLTAKKSAAARDRAAASMALAFAQPTDPSASASVGTMGLLAGLDGAGGAGGVGGPFVPVSANSREARAALARQQAAAAPGEGSSGLYAHLASERSEAEARAIYRSLQAQYSTVLGDRDAVIRRVDDTGQGSFYRVEVGPLTSSDADRLCGNIKAGGGLCVPRYE